MVPADTMSYFCREDKDAPGGDDRGVFGVLPVVVLYHDVHYGTYGWHDDVG